MKSAFLALLASRKFVAVLLARAVVTAFALAGKIPVSEVPPYVAALAGVLTMAIALDRGTTKPK
jgi:hypothetical protein